MIEHTFNTEQPDRVIIEKLPKNDLRALIGPGGLSSYRRTVEGGRAVIMKTYALEGVTSVDISSDVPEDTIIVGVDGTEAQSRVVEWTNNTLGEVYEAREVSKQSLMAHRGRNRH